VSTPAPAEDYGQAKVNPALLAEQDLAAESRGDVAAALALYSDDAIVQYGGLCWTPCVGKAAIQKELERRVAAKNRFTIIGGMRKSESWRPSRPNTASPSSRPRLRDGAPDDGSSARFIRLSSSCGTRFCKELPMNNLTTHQQTMLATWQQHTYAEFGLKDPGGRGECTRWGASDPLGAGKLVIADDTDPAPEYPHS